MSQNRTPLVSVCIPTYNYGRFIADCINSVLEQTISEWEIVICDDQSTDNTKEIVSRYAKNDPRIRYYCNPVRLGMNANIKRAADLGMGKYLKILCSDDWIAPTCLETLAGLMESHPSVALGTCAEIYTDSEGRPLRVQFLFRRPLTICSGEKMLDRMGFTTHGFGGNSSFIIRKSHYEMVGGYDSSTPYAGDLDLGARLCRVGDYLHTDEPLFYGRHHSASSSSNDYRRLVDVLDNFDIPHKVFQPRRALTRDWFRYNVYTADMTARYLLTVPIQYFRQNTDYARKMCEILSEKGNLFLGVPWIVPHLLVRIYRSLNRRLIPPFLPPDNTMGLPGRQQKNY